MSFLKTDNLKRLDLSVLQNQLELADGDWSFVFELLSLFEETTVELLQVMATNLNLRKADSLRSLCHRMRGSGLTIGTLSFVSLLGDFQECFSNDEWLEAERVFNEICIEFDGIKAEIITLQKLHSPQNHAPELSFKTS